MIYRDLNQVFNIIPGDGCVVVVEENYFLYQFHVFRVKILQHTKQLVRITVLTIHDHHDAGGVVDKLIDVLLGIIRSVPVLVSFDKLFSMLCIDDIQEFCI